MKNGKKKRENKKKNKVKSQTARRHCAKKYVAAYLPWIFNIAPDAVQWRSRGGAGGTEAGRDGV